MATTKGKDDSVALSVLSDPATMPPDPPPPKPPDKNDSPAPMTTLGSHKDSLSDPLEHQPVDSTKPILDDPQAGKLDKVKKLKILHIKGIPLKCNYEDISTSFCSFGTIIDIRMNFQENEAKWEAWITFQKHEDAFKASCNISSIQISESAVVGALTDKAPHNLDIYRPSEWNQEANRTSLGNNLSVRTPKPPMWLVAVAREDNYNYYKFSRHLQKKVGGIKSGDISRFGKNTVLIHAKSKTQSQMLCLMQSGEQDAIKEIRPHETFSYGRGVIFDKDLYEFSESELLDMCPSSVWKVKKTKSTNMMILTFSDENVPSHVVFENERVKARPFHSKPMQCYNCFKFGHTLKVCNNPKICINCLAQEHGECTNSPMCNNCFLAHKSTDNKCDRYKAEQAAVNKANAEHISIAYAKKLMGTAKSYAKALRPQSPTTTRGPVAAPLPEAGAATPVVEAQPSGPCAQSEKDRAHTSKEEKMAPTTGNTPGSSSLPAARERAHSFKEEKLAPEAKPTSGLNVQHLKDSSKEGNTTPEAKSTAYSKDGAASISLPSSNSFAVSQAEALPDLMETDNQKLVKRSRDHSSSPPSTPSKYVSLQNRYEVLNSLDKVQHKDARSKTTDNGKPNLSRPPLPKSAFDAVSKTKKNEKALSKGSSKVKK